MSESNWTQISPTVMFKVGVKARAYVRCVGLQSDSYIVSVERWIADEWVLRLEEKPKPDCFICGLRKALDVAERALAFLDKLEVPAKKGEQT